MEVDPTLLQDRGDPMGAVASVPGSVNVQQKRDAATNNSQEALGRTNEEGPDSCIAGGCSSENPGIRESAAAFSGEHFIQTPSQAGEAESRNFGDKGGHESHQMPRDWPTWTGAQQMGPIPGPIPNHGHYTYAHWGNQPFQHPISGPHHNVYPGPMPHHWVPPFGQGMQWHPHHGPHFGPADGRGPGWTDAPPHSVRSQQNSGQFVDMLGKALNGQASPQDLVNGLLNLNLSDDQFWKGVVAGGVAALILNSDSVRQVLSGMLGSVFGAPQGDDKGAGKAP